MKFLYAAYAATWVIHILYLTFISRAYSKVRDDIRELREK